MSIATRYSKISSTTKSQFSIIFLALVVLCQWDDSDADDEGLQLNEVQASPTIDKSPGLGAEFETGAFYLVGDPECSYERTNKLKGGVLGGREGDHWQLTVDTTLDAANRLQAEYILNGQTVKLGQAMAGPTAAAIAADLVLEWNPTLDSPGITMKDLDGCTWSIKSTSSLLGPVASILWQRQITAPMPLEALNDIIGKARANYAVPPVSLLPGHKGLVRNLVYVSTEFFQSSPGGAPTAPTSDVLGFFSLVLSYAKAADHYVLGDSPKFKLPIMPRNDFQSMFNLIRGSLGSSLDAGDSALYNIVKILACYTWRTDESSQFELEIDQLYCSGDLAAPVVSTKMDELKYELTRGKINPPPSFTIKEWMDDLQANKGDRMSAGDKTYDGQIGGFGDKMEYALDTTRLVPLFEFRDLDSSTASQFATLVTAAENDIINYHRIYRNPPTMTNPKRAVRRVHRQLAECPADMTSTPADTTSGASNTPSSTPSSPPTVTSFITSFVETTVPSITPTQSVSCYLQNQDPDRGINSRYCICESSITAPVLDSTLAQTALCAYTTLPGTTTEISVPTQTWTTNCQACTLVGGIADHADCTMVDGCTPTGITTSQTAEATPTIKAWVGNLGMVDIGDAEDGTGGKDLAKELFTKLRSSCNDTACESNAFAEMDNIETIVLDGELPIKPAMYMDDVRFWNDTVALERMLSLGIASWVSALNDEKSGLCKEVEYEADADETGSSCGTRPIPQERLRRTVRRDTGQVLWERDDLALQERCLDFCNAPHVCHYKGRVCSAPAQVDVVMAGDGDPYKYHLALSVRLREVNDGFSCEEIVLAVTDILEILAPELLPAEMAGEISFEAICGAIE
ncbi:hypothetical protein GGR58DRAFT_518547 [Xylaria digitata]|nr:hypothetical protein GGR58DRAFT_518547 [Xylaria digitata]